MIDLSVFPDWSGVDDFEEHRELFERTVETGWQRCQDLFAHQPRWNTNSDEWTYVKNLKGCRIHKTRVDYTNHMIFRGTAESVLTRKTPLEIASYILEVMANPELAELKGRCEPDAIYCESLHAYSETEHLFHSRYTMNTPLVSDRDFVSVSAVRTLPDNEFVAYYFCTSVPADDVPENWIREPRCVRGNIPIVALRIMLNPVADERDDGVYEIIFESVSCIEPKGWTPVVLYNSFASEIATTPGIYKAALTEFLAIEEEGEEEED